MVVKEQRVPQEVPVLMVPQDPQEIQEMSKEQQERRALLESKETKVLKEKLERQVNRETKDHPVKMVLTDSQDLLASRERRVTMVIRVAPVAQENRVNRTTVQTLFHLKVTRARKEKLHREKLELRDNQEPPVILIT